MVLSRRRWSNFGGRAGRRGHTIHVSALRRRKASELALEFRGHLPNQWAFAELYLLFMGKRQVILTCQWAILYVLPSAAAMNAALKDD